MEEKKPDKGKTPEKQAPADNTALTAGVAATTSAATTLATSAALKPEDEQPVIESIIEDVYGGPSGWEKIDIDDIIDHINENNDNNIIDIPCVYGGPPGWDEYDNPESLIDNE